MYPIYTYLPCLYETFVVYKNDEEPLRVFLVSKDLRTVSRNTDPSLLPVDIPFDLFLCQKFLALP